MITGHKQNLAMIPYKTSENMAKKISLRLADFGHLGGWGSLGEFTKKGKFVKNIFFQTMLNEF